MKFLEIKEIIKSDVLYGSANANFLFIMNDNQEFSFIDNKKENELSLLKNITIISYDKDVINYLSQRNIKANVVMLNCFCDRVDINIIIARLGGTDIYYKNKDFRNVLYYKAKHTQRIYEHVNDNIYAINEINRMFNTQINNVKHSSIVELIDAFSPSYSIDTTKDIVFKYKAPESISFKTAFFQNIFENIKNNYFIINNGVISHDYLPTDITYKDHIVRLVFGGLHSQIKNTVVEKCIGTYTKIMDYDANSYYASILCSDNIFRELLGDNIIDNLKSILNKKLNANHTVSKTELFAYKIILNSLTGKLNCKDSKFYNPRAYLQMTITGQLYLLMLFESFGLDNIKTLSINTDGISIKTDKFHKELGMINRISSQTGIQFKSVEYDVLCMDNVNNYFALTKDGELKGNGIYCFKNNVRKFNNDSVISLAIKNSLVRGIKLSDTIKNAHNSSYVNFGCVGDKVYAFYASVDSIGDSVRINDRKLPKSDDCKLVDKKVENINYSYYLDKAFNIAHKFDLEY